MSRRIRVNLTRWVCRKIGHRDVFHPEGWAAATVYCSRCGRFW